MNFNQEKIRQHLNLDIRFHSFSQSLTDSPSSPGSPPQNSPELPQPYAVRCPNYSHSMLDESEKLNMEERLHQLDKRMADFERQFKMHCAKMVEMFDKRFSCPEECKEDSADC